MIIAAVILFIVAVVIVGVTVAGATGILRVNTYAGIRIPSVLASQAAWEAGHLAALLPMTVAGLIAVAGGFAIFFRPGSGPVLIVVVLLVLALIGFGVVRADRAARRVV